MTTSFVGPIDRGTTADSRSTYLTVPEAAQYLRVSERTIRTLIAKSALPASQFVRHGKVLIRRDACDALVETSLIAPQAVSK